MPGVQYWRLRLTKPGSGGAGPIGPMLAKRTAFGDFSPGSGRRQCSAIAKTTGARCRKDCIGGTTRCKSHGGIRYAMRKLRQKYGAKAQMRAPNHLGRRILFAAGLKTPDGFESDAIGIERGKQAEVFQNVKDVVGLSKRNE